MWMEILCPHLRGLIAALQKDEVVKCHVQAVGTQWGLQKIRAGGERRGRDRSRAGHGRTDSW